MTNGKFIVFEGINGCGKGTQLELITKFLYDLDPKRKHTHVIRTREPNELDENGLNARKALKESKDPYEGARACVGYFAMNRVTHNNILIRPSLEIKNTFVLSDRYWHSNFAFQHAQGIPIEEIKEANKTSTVPDLTIIYDLPVSVANDRLARRDGSERRKFDSNSDFMEKVRENYRRLSEHLVGFDNSIVVVDANRSIEEVYKATKNVIQRKILQLD